MTTPIKYATDIVKGKIPAGEFVHQAAQRFLDDLKRKDLYFDEEGYNKVVRFFNEILWEGETWNGEPVQLMPPQLFILANIFGLKWKKNGFRKHKTIYIQVGRKNTKTTTIAGLALFELLGSGEADPHIPVGANNENQAKICTTQAAKMVRAANLESELAGKIYEYRGNTQKITHRSGSIEAMSKEARTKDGLLISMAVIDEYHEAPDGRLLNVFESGMGNRMEPLSIIITTAGYNKKGPCYQTLRKSSIDILNGVLSDDTHFSFICEPDPDDNYGDRDTWRKANPMMDYIPSIEPYLEGRWKKAQNEGGETMVEFITKNLNMWADSSAAPIMDKEWLRNARNAKVLTPADIAKEMDSEVCWAGIDLGDTGDMTACVFLFPGGDILPLFWIPERQLQHKDNAILYKRWVEEGFLRVAGEEVADYRQIASEIGEFAQKFNLRVTGYDKYRMSHGTIQELLDDGMNIADISMSYSMLTDPTEEFIKTALEGGFNHYNNPILRWMVSNLEIERKGTYKMPSKGKSQNKIDGVVALIIAICTKNASPEPTEFKIYAI